MNLYCAISVCFILLPSVFAKEDPIVTIPLMRHKTPREIGMNIKGIPGLSTESLKPNYLYNKPKPGPKPGPTNDSVAVYRYLDSEFYAVIQIGKKARPFNLLIDTAWGHTWVISEDCPYVNIGCWFHNKYDHTKSSSYIENGTEIVISQNSYNLSGFLSIDTFHLEQLNVTHQTFIEMVDVPPSFALSKADGVLGLGYASLAEGITPIFYNLFKQGKIKKALFSIYLNRDRSSNRGGNLILGRIEPRHVLANHTITYLPVNSTGYWQFKMDRVQLDDDNKSYPFCVDGCQAIADSSTNAISGPYKDINKLNKVIGARYMAKGRYHVACDTINILPVLTFVIGGNEFTLHGRDYVQRVSYKSFTLCLSAFSGTPKSTQDFWVLGGAFLTEYYSIYNLEKNIIGFVKAA